MRLSLLSTLTVALLLQGCGRTPKVDNPVLGPPPPRVSFDDSQSRTDGFGDVAYVNDPLDPQVEGAEPGEYIQTAGTDRSTAKAIQPPGLNQSNVVARVNGEPILEGDVLEPYSRFFEQNADRMRPNDVEKAKMQILKRDLDGHVERVLLTQALRSGLKGEQFDQMKSRLGDYFEEYAKEIMEKADVTTKYELAVKLEKEGQSLESLERTFVNRQLALVYMRQNVSEEIRVGRTDLLDYYQRHSDDYLLEEQVKWQRIQVQYRKHGGKLKAVEHLEKAINELREGAEFADVARRYSDGRKAKTGGYQDWTRRGELANEEVDKALFRLPLNTPSRIFEDKTSYQIVRVLERQERGYVPFEEVQEEIRAAVEREKKNAESDRVIAELRKTAEITTVLDDEPLVDDDVKLPFN